MTQTRFLTASEELMFVDDRPAYPSCCFLRATFAGALDRGAFQAATRLTLQRHPLLRAKVTRRFNRLEWEFVEDPTPQIDWIMNPDEHDKSLSGGIDLTTEIGIRIRVSIGGSGSELLIQFHHSACDGRGMLRFLDELLASYGQVLSNEGTVAKHASDARLMPHLGEIKEHPLSALQRVLPHFLEGVRHGWTVIRRVPSPLLPHSAAPNESALGHPYPAANRETFSREDTDAFFTTAKSMGVTGNDLLLTSAFLTLHDWREGFDLDRDEWIRVLSPIDLRTPSERTHPASNIVSGFFLDRRGADFVDPHALLRGVHLEMTRNKQREFGRMFQLAIALCRYLPGGLTKQVLAKKCLLSLVLTNLGRVLEDSSMPRKDGRIVAGNVLLESVEILPPLRPYVCASFSAATYAGCLTVTLHYDPRMVTLPAAGDLLSAFKKRLYSWLVAKPAAMTLTLGTTNEQPAATQA